MGFAFESLDCLGRYRDEEFGMPIELGLGCGGLHPATRMIYAAPSMPRSPLDSPDFAFSTLFGGINPDQL